MALIDMCDTCGGDFDVNTLMRIDALDYLMCEYCINELINDLASGLSLEECGA